MKSEVRECRYGPCDITFIVTEFRGGGKRYCSEEHRQKSRSESRDVDPRDKARWDNNTRRRKRERKAAMERGSQQEAQAGQDSSIQG